MIDIHRLRVFRAVVAEGSIAGAATGLGFTPSAISQHLSALQRETGLTLLERRGRGLVATDAGRILAARSDAVFTSIAGVDALVGDLRDGRVGMLSMSYFSSAGAAWIPSIVATLTREFPDVRLDLRLIELQADGASPADVEIYVAQPGDDEPDGSDHHCRTLMVEPYLAVVHTDNPLSAHRSIPLAALRDEVWVDNDVIRGPCRQAVLQACAAVGFTPSFGVETHDYATAVRFVAEGVGISVIPRLGVGELPPNVTAVCLTDPTPTRTIAVRVRRRCADDPAIRRALTILQEQIDRGVR